ncbi:MAG: serine/threonine-protein kinase [Nannocystaceae bacterium]|nr:serine/threonine protein kinase [bacterium]
MAGVGPSTQPTSAPYHGQVHQDPMIGRWVLDQYVVRAKIGEGGMGAVYLAEQPSVGRNAVIKIMHPWLSRDPKIAARFDTEARAAARLQNPHIVSVYNYGRLPDSTLFIAMEYLEGYTLADLMRAQGRVDPHRAVAIARQVCEALDEAHRRGVVHRDLTPNNLMLLSRRDGPDFVKVLDFGVAKLHDAEVTGRGAVGTPGYMAPEQLRDEPVDGRADIYALALILYEMLTGRAAFEASSPAALMNKHLNELPRPMAAACPGLDINPQLEACVMRGLAKHAYQRPQSADAFAEELWTTIMGTRMFSAPIDVAPPATPRVSNGAVVVAIAATLALLGGAGALAYTLWTGTDADPPQAERSPAVAPRAPITPGLQPPSPAKQALMLHTVAELEAELERVTLLSGLPRSAIDLSLAEYRRAAVDPPPGADPEAYRKSLLAELILRWREAESDSPSTDRDLDELEAVFLMMRSPFDVQTRLRMLAELKKSTAKEPDPETAVKRKLLEWIATFGDAPDDEAPVVVDE